MYPPLPTPSLLSTHHNQTTTNTLHTPQDLIFLPPPPPPPTSPPSEEQRKTDCFSPHQQVIRRKKKEEKRKKRKMRSLLLLVSLAVGNFMGRNPFLIGTQVGIIDPITMTEYDIIITTDPILDDELFHFVKILRSDFETYRNHCLRIATFTQYFLPESIKNEIPNSMELVSIALAYHKIGLWSDKTLAYLESSIKQMEDALTVPVTTTTEGITTTTTAYSSKEIAIIREMISQQFKWYEFNFNNDLTENEFDTTPVDVLINAVRKANWADCTLGIIRFGMPSALLQAAYTKLPSVGFHKLLFLSFPTKLYSSDYKTMILDIFKVLQW